MSKQEIDPRHVNNTCFKVGEIGLAIIYLLAVLIFGGIALYDWINPL